MWRNWSARCSLSRWTWFKFLAWCRYRNIRRKPSFRYNPVPMTFMHGTYCNYLVAIKGKASRVAPARLPSRILFWGWSGREGGSGRRQQHGVDHMDHTVRLVDVRDRDHRLAALGVDDPDLAAVVLDGQLFALGGLQLHAVLEVGSGELAGHDMVGEDLGQGRLVLRLDQRLDRAGRQLAESGVGRREHRERALAFEGLDQAGGLHRGDQGGVILRVDGVLDDVLGGEHRSTADHHGLLLRGNRRSNGRSEGERREGGRRQQGNTLGHWIVSR